MHTAMTTTTPTIMPLQSSKLAQTPHWLRYLSRLMLVVLILLPFVLLFVPWTQTVHGNGRAIAFNPTERPQFVVSPIEGRIKKWYVVEGDKVKAGQRIVEMVDNDPNLELRLLDEERAIQDRIRAMEGRIQEIESRIRNIQSSRELQLAVQEGVLRIERERAQNFVLQEIEAQAALDAAEPNYRRQKELFENAGGALASKRDVELSLQNLEVAKAKLKQAQRMVQIGKDAVKVAEDNLTRLDHDTAAMINSEKAILRSAEADFGSVRRDDAQMKVRIARQRAQYVEANADGTIWRLLANADQGGILVRPGERLAVMVPDIVKHIPKLESTATQVSNAMLSLSALLLAPITPVGSVFTYLPTIHAVYQSWPLTDPEHPGIVAELLMDGNDLPLIHKGDKVRLQFEGWPAVQFVGWPSVAVGTFGGMVYLVDPTANDKGQFRILVEPDPAQPAWPGADYLRQGVRTQGWVLLNRVSIGWELWRQLNGFPPTREQPDQKSSQPLGPVNRK